MAETEETPMMDTKDEKPSTSQPKLPLAEVVDNAINTEQQSGGGGDKRKRQQSSRSTKKSAPTDDDDDEEKKPRKQIVRAARRTEEACAKDMCLQEPKKKEDVESLKAPRTYLEAFDFDTYGELINREDGETVANYNAMSANNVIWDDRADGPHGDKICMGITDFVFVMSCERHTFETTGNTQDDDAEVGKFYPTRPDWLYEQRRAEMHNMDMLICTGVINVYFEEDGVTKSRTMADGERSRITVPMRHSGTERFIVNDSVRTFVVTRVFSKVLVVERLDEYWAMRESEEAAKRQKKSDAEEEDKKPNFLSMSSEELHAAARSLGKEILTSEEEGDDFAGCETQIYFYLDGTPDGTVVDFAEMFEREFRTPSDKMARLANCDEHHFEWEHDPEAQERANKDKATKYGEEEEDEERGGEEDDDYDGEMCDNDVAEIVEWLAESPAYTRVFLDRCLSEDAVDPYVEPMDGSPFTAQPYTYKFFQRPRIRALANNIANKYYLDLNMVNLVHMWEMGFRGWRSEAAKFKVGRNKGVKLEKALRRGLGAVRRVVSGAKKPAPGASALIFTTPESALTFGGMMPLALNLRSFGRRNKMQADRPINVPFDEALIEWAKAVGKYKTGMTSEDIVTLLQSYDPRKCMEEIVSKQKFEGTATADEFNSAAQLMRCLFDNFYHDYEGFERVCIANHVTANTTKLTPHCPIVFKGVRVCKKTNNDHCMGIHIERKMKSSKSKVCGDFFVFPGDVVEVDIKEAAFVMGMVTRVDADEGDVTNSKLHVIPLAPLTSYPITYSISAKHELVVTPSLCDIVKVRDVVRVVDNVVVRRDNAEDWSKGGSYLRPLMLLAAQKKLFARSVVEASGQAVRQLPTRLLHQMRQQLTAEERKAIIDKSLEASSNESIAASARQKCRVMAGCPQCAHELSSDGYPSAMVDGRVQLTSKFYIAVGSCLALKPIYWKKKFAKEARVKELIKRLVAKKEFWLANCLERKFIRRCPWSQKTVVETVEELAREHGDLVEVNRWTKEYCSGVDYHQKFYKYAGGGDDENMANRVFDDEQPSLDLCIVKSIDEEAGSATVARLMRVEQTDITTAQLEEYVFAEKELFVDEMEEFTITLSSLKTQMTEMAWVRPLTDEQDKAAVDKEVVQWLKDGPNRFIARTPITITETETDIAFMPTNLQTDAELVPLSEEMHDLMNKEWAESAPGIAEMKPGVSQMATLDLFAGCGGLSMGLEQAGVLDAKHSYAVEFDAIIANVYRANHSKKGVKMFTSGVGEFLHMCYAKDKGTTEFMPDQMKHVTLEECKHHPVRGMIKLIVGGPPCQGYSGLNSSKSGKASTEKRQHIVSFLSAVCYFRPDYCIMENVRGLAGSVHDGISGLGQCIVALLAMGMQVRMQCLQAAAYGVPQNRVRIFIVGAAPGKDLAMAPLPTHSVDVDLAEFISVGPSDRLFSLPSPSMVDHRPLVEHTEHRDPICSSGVDWRAYTVCDALSDEQCFMPPLATSAMHAPLNIVTAISDLGTDYVERNYCRPYPHIRTDHKMTIPVEHAPPKSWFQIMQRGDVDRITSHQSKILTALDAARVALVPNDSVIPDSDWRVLPNRIVPYGPDGKMRTEVLQYIYNAREFGAYLENRGICPCNDDYHEATMGENAMKRRKNDKSKAMALCLPYKQTVQSLIPYCLCHTAEGKNNWAGLFGRSYRRQPFQTIICTMTCTSKQGRVLHYNHNRTFTGRELARAQAFPDSMNVDEGNFGDMVRVIGNAVPPPLTRAIGFELIKVLNAHDPRDATFDDPPM